jgi:hypothetical protein
MGKSLPIALHESVVSFVEAGHSHRGGHLPFPCLIALYQLLHASEERDRISAATQARRLEHGKLGGHHDE